MKQINSIVIPKETGMKHIINNIAYKILDKSPESSNNPDERKTSVNFKPFNSSEKATEKNNLSWNHDRSKWEVFPPLTRFWEMWIRALPFDRRERGNKSKRRCTGLAWTSWESCLIRCPQFQLQEIFTFRSLEGVRVQLGFSVVFRCLMYIQKFTPWSLVAQRFISNTQQGFFQPFLEVFFSQ